MADLSQTLGTILSDPLLSPIASDAIRGMDLPRTPMWGKTLAELRREGFGGDLRPGLERLFAAARTGAWFFPLYTEAECADNPHRRDVSLVWFPSEEAGAGDRPWILLAPGGGFVNVWNLTEGWPVAAQFNRLGYHVFILTYRVTEKARLLDGEMDDFARAIELVRRWQEDFRVRWDRYITCGFSAGGYLVCLWNVREAGFAAHGLPAPRAVFPVYPLTSWRLCARDSGFRPEDARLLFGMALTEAASSFYEIPDHAEAFPPCALFLSARDALVNPEHARLLAHALAEAGIPCRLEIGPDGGHGFADGAGMSMAGWTERAARWFEGLPV